LGKPKIINKHWFFRRGKNEKVTSGKNAALDFEAVLLQLRRGSETNGLVAPEKKKKTVVGGGSSSKGIAHPSWPVSCGGSELSPKQNYI